MEKLSKDNSIYDDNSFDCLLKTKRNMITYSIKWEIDKFHAIPDRESLISPDFHVVPGKKYCLKATKVVRDLIVDLHCEMKPDELLQCTFSIANSQGQLIYERIGELNNTKQYNLTDISIQNCSADLNSPVNERLIFKCFIKLYESIETNLYSTQRESPNETQAVKKLTEDLKYILDNSIGTDVTLVMNDGQVAAHKIILSARSPVFNRMFQYEMKETNNNKVKIDDVEFSVVEQLVNFLYCGELNSCDSEVDTLCSLYYAADKYNIPDLQRLCGEALIRKLDINNACQLLAFLDRHEDKFIKPKVVEFIHLYLGEVVDTSGWQAFMNSKLSAEVIK